MAPSETKEYKKAFRLERLALGIRYPSEQAAYERSLVCKKVVCSWCGAVFFLSPKRARSEFQVLGCCSKLDGRVNAAASYARPDVKMKSLIRHSTPESKRKKSEAAKARKEKLKQSGEWKAHLRRRALNPSFRIRKSVSRAIRMHVGKGTGSKRTEMLTGCSMKFLRHHLESRFKDGMSWNNYGSAWHIDHIIPLAKWNLLEKSQAKLAFHWSNLQPLWASENLQKRDKITERQISLPISFYV